MLCESCHEKARHFDQQHRLLLAAECNAPIGTGDDVKFIEDFNLVQVRSAARALLKNTEKKIPESRIVELTTLLRAHYSIEDLTHEQLTKWANSDIV